MKLAVLLFSATFAAFPPPTQAAAELVTRASATGHRDYQHAKQVLPRVHGSSGSTFYCGCPYRGKSIDLRACGYTIRKDASRARRVEWEHIVPAWAIGHQRQCWQRGGRKHCSATDAAFRKAEGDLHNLVPAIGELNNDRSNFRYTVWDNQPRMYGQCQMVVDFKGRRAQPPQRARGAIARATFYMVETYRLNLSAQERRLYCVWARTYPVTEQERVRDRKIQAIQGNSNRYVSDPGAIAAQCG
ncbi:endonuclease [Bordetella genomosp. 7]|uniref:Endonuclease n=1 Tax=Bordetella genomosp. 7 TaxID=1416805 RepID=A0A261RJK2_9BORD|nr:endonuclease [Bordetella genomosp. 7]OZI25209.1 endonuclease [Bordetella genomosp. 7]